MSRQLRIDYPGAIYHVMSRGNRRERIFRDEEDRRLFLAALEGTVSIVRTDTCLGDPVQAKSTSLVLWSIHQIGRLENIRWSVLPPSTFRIKKPSLANCAISALALNLAARLAFFSAVRSGI